MPAVFPIAPQSDEERQRGAWTISSRTHHALVTAEARFGARDPDFALSGYMFNGDIPMLRVDPTGKKLVLILADYTEHDPNQAVYQLSHEVVHMLAPRGFGRPTYLEEGLATLFSEQYTEGATGARYGSPVVSYTQARDAVAQYMTNDGIMRALRALEPTFAFMTPAMLTTVRPDCPADLAAFLCGSFQR